MLSERPDLSVVIPFLNEQDVLPILKDRLLAALHIIPCAVELVLVDDGSTDATLPTLAAFARDDQRVKVLVLSRNFGHQAALTAGLDHARGQVVATMDADLQDPPELLADMYRKVLEGADIVYAVRRRRRGNRLKRVAYWLYYRIAARLMRINVPVDVGDFCMMKDRVVAALRSLPERRRYLRGLRSWVGFRQIQIGYDRDERAAGRPKYTFPRLAHLALDGIFTMTEGPLKLATLAGLGISAVAVLYAAVLVYWRLTTLRPITGFATLAVGQMLFGGLQLVFLGIIGEYIARIHAEVKQRPTYLVREILQGDVRSSSGGDRLG